VIKYVQRLWGGPNNDATLEFMSADSARSPEFEKCHGAFARLTCPTVSYNPKGPKRMNNRPVLALPLRLAAFQAAPRIDYESLYGR
jgi:hypothetical protein